MRHLRAARRALLSATLGVFAMVLPLGAHPHVFIDGGIDFAFDGTANLQGITVTWIYDPFETLYMLSEMDVTPSGPDGFTDEERQIVEANLSDFPADFDGSAHLSIGAEPVALGWPSDLTAQMRGERLALTFTRTLDVPLPMDGRALTAAFYERTYFFDFSLTEDSKITGSGDLCSATRDPFKASEKTAEMQQALAKLSREESPADSNVGAQFADRVVVTCGNG
ncbi:MULTISPECIES: DUF1007 family protein [unclassified Marinovum]